MEAWERPGHVPKTDERTWLDAYEQGMGSPDWSGIAGLVVTSVRF